MPKYEPEKTPTEELVDASKQAVQDYESYLLDQLGWRELAQTMTALRKQIVSWESKMKSR